MRHFYSHCIQILASVFQRTKTIALLTRGNLMIVDSLHESLKCDSFEPVCHVGRRDTSNSVLTSVKRERCSSLNVFLCMQVCEDRRIQRLAFLLFSRQTCPARTRSSPWARFIRARTSWHWNTSPTRGAPSRTASVSLSPPSRIQVSTFLHVIIPSFFCVSGACLASALSDTRAKVFFARSFHRYRGNGRRSTTR